MQLTDFSTLTFDCYGTLIDWEKGILNELQPWVRRNGLEIPDDRILELFGEEESRAEAQTPDRLYPKILEDVIVSLAHRLTISASAEAKEAFGASVARWPAFPDSTKSLQYLKQHYKLVILSNVDRNSFAYSNKRLQVDFDYVFTAQDVGSYKPDLRNFRYSLARLKEVGIEERNILHTAQSLFHDIVPARKLGLSTAWINRRKGLEGWGATPVAQGDAVPDLEVASLAELASLDAAQRNGSV